VKTGEQSPDGREIWFPAKKYGWGWGPPNCWQGWLLLLSWLAALVGGMCLIRPMQHPVASLVYYAGFFILLLIVFRLKGAKPGWHWGRK
jgi:hypothetical protein